MTTIRMFLFIGLFLFSGFLQADEKKKVCLNMIVKDESAVIERCLNSVLPIIDYWVIVDTGSTDGTQKIIHDFMAKQNKPGELHERPWKNFGHNRNEALDLARDKGDYILFIDADNTFIPEPNFEMPSLDKDFYYVNLLDAGSKYVRIALINTKLPWKWEGVLHEAVCSAEARTYDTLQNISQLVRMDGARSKDPKKYEKDAAILEAALLEEPNNARYVYYLAQSYKNADNFPMALKNFEKRATMGDWDQEAYCAFLNAAKVQEYMEMPKDKVVDAYNKAFQYRKTRIEPLYYLMSLYNQGGEYEKGYKIGKIAQTLKPTTDTLFVEQWMYDYGIDLELSVSAYWLERYKESQKLSQKLLKKELPDDIQKIVRANLEFANGKLLEKLVATE